ncbi:aminoglycoside phosphotransferase family protein [Methylobacterium aquaticum]|uniref:aminoglycoside phosphotransferase family protein n=1 Tax=Methylobacterium aquaticum TaxID=270351 RepID=UPI003D17DCE1
MMFPQIANSSEFAQWRSSPSNWTALVQSIAQAEAIHAPTPRAFGTGTNLVVDLDGRFVLKLFPPIYRTQFHSERITLRQLAGCLTVPIPSLVAEGMHDGWSWLILSKLDGIIGSDAWPTLAERDKESILRQIGRTIAEVQALPVADLIEIKPSWSDFIARQVEACVERHRRNGLVSRLLTDISALLASVPSVVPLDQPPVILTGEWIPENFLLAETVDGWTLAAVIDFGDVMTGWREYDLLGPSAFMCGGKPGRVRSLFDGYGITVNECDNAMRRRLLTLMLLHRASDLRNIWINDWESRVGMLPDLANIIWPRLDGCTER